MLVHRRVTAMIKFAGTPLYTWVERGAVRVKCLTQEHNTMSPARAQTWTTQSAVKRTNHEATAPLTFLCNTSIIFLFHSLYFLSIYFLFWCICMFSDLFLLICYVLAQSFISFKFFSLFCIVSIFFLFVLYFFSIPSRF